MKIMEKYSIVELKRISHSLGIRLFESVMSHKKKDKKLPDVFYRNHYSINNCEVFEGLVCNGFAFKRNVLDKNCYHVSDLGIEKFKKEFADLVNYKPKKERNLIYVKKRINFYCEFYNYKFSKDNSEHITSMYVNYFLKDLYLSHTTKDCMSRFEKELRPFKKEIFSKQKKD